MTVPALAGAAAGLLLPLVLWVHMNEMVAERKCRLPVQVLLAFFVLPCTVPLFTPHFYPTKSPPSRAGGAVCIGWGILPGRSSGVPGGALAPGGSESLAAEPAPPGEREQAPTCASRWAARPQPGCRAAPALRSRGAARRSCGGAAEDVRSYKERGEVWGVLSLGFS